MTYAFSTLKTRLANRVQRADLAASYGGFWNEALRTIQDRKSWTWMKAQTTVTLPSGLNESLIALPASYKELQHDRPVNIVNDDGSLTPVEVVTEHQQIQRVWTFGGTPIQTWPPRVFLLRNADGTASLGMVEPRESSITFRVDYYGYLPDLVNDSDTSLLVNNYFEMCWCKARQVAFDEINDPIADQFGAKFEAYFFKASQADSYADVAGKSYHM